MSFVERLSASQRSKVLWDVLCMQRGVVVFSRREVVSYSLGGSILGYGLRSKGILASSDKAQDY